MADTDTRVTISPVTVKVGWLDCPCADCIADRATAALDAACSALAASWPTGADGSDYMARRIARIDPADLNDGALGRYANQWAGTTRGGAALAEIARRKGERVAFDASGPTGATFNRCKCSGCRELAEREAEIRAARATDDTPVLNTFNVTEHIRHGDYRYDLTETATTLLGAVYAVLAASPYCRPTRETADRITADLFTTGHAELGWSTFER